MDDPIMQLPILELVVDYSKEEFDIDDYGKNSKHDTKFAKRVLSKLVPGEKYYLYFGFFEEGTFAIFEKVFNIVYNDEGEYITVIIFIPENPDSIPIDELDENNKANFPLLDYETENKLNALVIYKVVENNLNLKGAGRTQKNRKRKRNRNRNKKSTKMSSI